MKSDIHQQLLSIRRILNAILGVLLLSFGFAHTPVAKSEFGANIAVAALITGILIIVVGIISMVFRFIIALARNADKERPSSAKGSEF